MKLDTSKHYGRIVGRMTDYPTAAFTQYGKFFDVKGDQVNAKTLRNEQDEEKGNEVRQNDGREIGHDDGRQDDDGRTDGQHEAQADAQAGNEKTNDDERQNAKGHVLSSDIVMDKTEDELKAIAESGMKPLRKYADNFGVKGTSKTEIIKELLALK